MVQKRIGLKKNWSDKNWSEKNWPKEMVLKNWPKKNCFKNELVKKNWFQ